MGAGFGETCYTTGMGKIAKSSGVIALVLALFGCQPSTTITPAKSEASTKSFTVKAERESVKPAPPAPPSRAVRFYVEAPK